MARSYVMKVAMKLEYQIDILTLKDLGFQINDLLDVAIL
ncbi:hypothetical protein A2U01_0074170 [Trifolium medium]|uniref:Uncharacterized protein n=1 Tax=Trifolium medium TaxID=97028 RepID=A0A392SXI0_9FABA|nr:hypothetical protein [Trifolium medium]